MVVAGPSYELHKKRMAEQSRKRSMLGRDIGSIPPIVNPERRKQCRTSFRLFCETYFPKRFHLGWSPDHLIVIARIETVVMHGGLFAIAMPRGNGKTTLCVAAAIWATLYGWHRYTMMIGQTKDKGKKLVESIKSEFQNNDLLLEDFPEALYPIRCLENETRRALGQTHYGTSTMMKWKDGLVIMPTINGSQCSGTIIESLGLEGDVRGANLTSPEGDVLRPTLVIPDDPQTDESARSPTQCDTRLALMNGAVLGLGPPTGKPLAGIMPCTVIQEGDMADRVLDRKISPDWCGERMKMIYEFPTNTKLWDEYAIIRTESLEQYGDIRDATAFYINNRKAMDEGGRAAWDERYKDGEVSAIQHAMNKLYQDERAFWAEYQNEPLPDNAVDEGVLSIEEICKKTNNHKRGVVPIEMTNLVGYIDIQDKVLYWGVLAFDDDFNGSIIDYGTFPDQRLRYYTLANVRKTLKLAFPGESLESRIYQGLDGLGKIMAGHEYEIDGGKGVMSISKVLIDANWGYSTNTVFKWCRENDHGDMFMPCHGRGIGASHQPMNEYKKKKGEKLGHNWYLPTIKDRRTIRHVAYDTNYWKSFLHGRLCVPKGGTSTLTLFKHEHKNGHRMLAEHLRAETRYKTEGRGRLVDEWKLVNKNQDNHWLDVFAGCYVAASMMGATMKTLLGNQKKKRRRRRMSDMQRGVA